MASVFWGSGHPADEVADFDEYDPTPYGGGYDIALTFGRALPPSDEICHPISTASSSSSSYDRPQQGRRPPAEETHLSVGHGRRPDDDEATHGGGYRKPKPAYGDDEQQRRHTSGGGRKKHVSSFHGPGPLASRALYGFLCTPAFQASLTLPLFFI